MLYCLCFAAFLSVWRAWYGGSYGWFGDITRIFKYAALVAGVFAVYWIKGCLDWKDWQMYAVAASLCYFWCRGHGDYFYVNDTGKDEARCKWIDWVLRQVFGEDGYYNFAGNCSGMLLRYSSVALITAAALQDGWFCMAGALVASVYGLAGKLFPNKSYTKISEYVAGFGVGVLFYLCV